MSEYKVDSDAMRKAAPSFKELAEAIRSSRNALLTDIGNLGNCWGDDKYGKAFHDDGPKGPGYGGGSKAILEQIPNVATGVQNVESKIRRNAAGVDGNESGTGDRYPQPT